MTRWRRLGKIWCLWPARPTGLVEMIGGSYLSASPQISYRRLLEGLAQKGLAVHTWSYLPGLDHQAQANEAWKDLRVTRQRLLSRIGEIPSPLRLGHSLGCKLHLLAPDGGRGSKALIAMSFNNFTADKSIPMLEKVKGSLGFHAEFSPSPKETMRLIHAHYYQKSNLLMSFGKDSLDPSSSLFECLQNRDNDASQRLQLDGDHLTPVSAGLRKKLLGVTDTEDQRTRNLHKTLDTISNWAIV